MVMVTVAIGFFGMLHRFLAEGVYFNTWPSVISYSSRGPQSSVPGFVAYNCYRSFILNFLKWGSTERNTLRLLSKF